jgi:hypothetical protein
MIWVSNLHTPPIKSTVSQPLKQSHKNELCLCVFCATGEHRERRIEGENQSIPRLFLSFLSYSPHIHRIFTAYSPIPRLFPAYSPPIPRLCVQNMMTHSERLLVIKNYCVIAYSPHIHRLFLPRIHRVFTAYFPPRVMSDLWSLSEDGLC